VRSAYVRRAPAAAPCPQPRLELVEGYPDQAGVLGRRAAASQSVSVYFEDVEDVRGRSWLGRRVRGIRHFNDVERCCAVRFVSGVTVDGVQYIARARPPFLVDVIAAESIAFANRSFLSPS